VSSSWFSVRLTITSDKMLQSGSFTALNNPDDQAIREEIGVYYNYFTKPSDDENVVFSVPYNDTGGLGMYASYRTSFCQWKTNCSLVFIFLDLE